MKQEIADRWVAALRSGEYEQGRHALKEDNKFCCLGVLCEIAVADGVVEYTESVDEYDDYQKVVGKYNRASAFLPPEVIDWAGMRPNNDSGRLGSIHDDSLVSLNDSWESFDFIAKVIEENVRRL